MSKTLDADVNGFTYSVTVVPLDSWDGERFRFQYRDDSGWHTVESDNYQHLGTDGDRWPNVDCSRWESPPERTYSGTISDIDGTLYEIRFTNGLEQDDHDESMAIDRVAINRTD
ncbi:hypothetical protein [Halorussus caseinilyticus]|uniref:Uncharacterized protein n=1 Tax=Halorussus caseinilyticus TaxID=3034025 RepID=A0ABD5WT54_9EURY